MRRRQLSSEELSRVINLRKSDHKWLQIQKDTGISRYIAKREYENWERSEALGELKEARKVVAAEAFRDHINHLIQIAESLAGHLVAPAFADRAKTGDQFLDKLWAREIIFASAPHTLSGTGTKVDQLRNLRENRMLFQSLMDHTRGKIEWKDLNQWKQRWNECTSSMQNLRDEVIKIIDDFLNREESQIPGLRANIGKDAQFNKPVEQMARAVIIQKLRWMENKTPRELQEEVTRLYKAGSKVQLIFADSYAIILIFHDTALAEIANRTCNLAARNFGSKEWQERFKSLGGNIGETKRLTDKFKEILDPLVLRPLILRTRCELCPA